MCYDISYKIGEGLLEYLPHYIIDDEEFDMGIYSFDHRQGVAIFPKHPIFYIQDNELHLKVMEWGIIKMNEKVEPQMVFRNKMLNIRSERIWSDPKSYWYKIKNQRCLIPVTGVYEHREINKKGWKKKVPYLIKLKDENIFFLPGLYSIADVVDKTTGEVTTRFTFAIITRDANSGMRNIHNSGEFAFRMPLFVKRDMAMEYISEGLTVDRYREILKYELPSEDLTYYPVNTIRTPKPRPDGKDKTEPWEWEGLPVLGECNPEIIIN